MYTDMYMYVYILLTCIYVYSFDTHIILHVNMTKASSSMK